MDKLSQTISKPLITGAVGSLLSKMILNGADMNLYGYSIPSYLVDGVIITSASYVNEISKNYTLPLLGLNDQGSKTVQMIASPLLTGGFVAASVVIFNGGDSSGLLTSVLLGASSEIAGQYAGRVVFGY